ncbi:MAG: hypothetical protein IKG30_04660 [Clostridiales bacterium]|nr:hypothetical protein [Clostridiales bacterium]
MNEVFDSEFINVEYRKDDDIVLVVLKGKVIRDDFRTPMMHAADMVLRHSCKIMAVDFGADLELSESDINWSKKILLSNLKKNGLEVLILIDSCGLDIVGKCNAFCEDRFKTIVCKSYEEGKTKMESEGLSYNNDVPKHESSDGDLSSMTREEALAYMGLEKEADIKAIDDRFWQMSKHYRGKDDPESKKKDDEISEIYDIASGRRDRRAEEKIKHDSEPMYFGRYKSDWQNIIHYNWKNFLLGIVVAVSALLVIIAVATNTRSGCSIVVFGHMYLDDTYMREALVANGIKRPYIGVADVVVPNDQNIPAQEYGNETFNAMFYTNPDVLISDKESYGYYFSTFKDLGPLYDRIMDGLTDEAKAGVEPVYMTEQEAVEYTNRLYLENGIGDEEIEDPSTFSDVPVLIGIEIKDSAIATKLGVEAKWMSRTTTLVFGQCMNSNNDDQTVLVITTILNAAFA